MSIKAKVLKRLYDKNKVTKDGLKQSVMDGVITRNEYKEITGEEIS